MKPSSRRKRSASAGPKATPAPAAYSPSRARFGSLRAWALAAGLLLLGLLLYWPSLKGPFVLDDFDLMEVFSAVRVGDWHGLRRTGRPLLMLSYVLNHRLAGGFHPYGFHLTNVLLHGLNAILLWRFLALLFAPGRLDKHVTAALRPLLIYGVPLLFLTSPIETESVAYISSRSEILAVTFYLLALVVFASSLRESRPWLTAVLVIVFSGAAALTKQDKVTLPFVILLLDYLLLAGTDWRRLKKNLPTYGLFAVGLVVAYWRVIRPFLFADSAGFGLDWKSYLFTQCRMFFLYLRLLLVPVGLNLDRDIAPSHSLGEHFAWLGLLGIVLLAAAVIRYHRRFPVIAFGALFFVVTLAPSAVYPKLDFAAERWLYLPSIGFYLACLVVLYLLAGAARPALAVTAAVAVAFSIGTYQRSQQWSSDVRLWQDTAEKSPGKARPWTWLGRIYIERGQYALALQALDKGAQVVEPRSPEQAHLFSDTGLAYANMKQYPEAIGAYRRAVEILPDEPLFQAHLAVALIHGGRNEEGWREFENAFQTSSKTSGVHPELYRLRGQEYFQDGRYREAAADFGEALRLRPDDAVASKNLAAAEEMMRRRGMQ
jgi:protein O-mannosyl-transferase